MISYRNTPSAAQKRISTTRNLVALIAISIALNWLLLSGASQAATSITLLEAANNPQPIHDLRIDTTPTARGFSPETLYSLLTAEIAGSREQYDIALNNYVQQAKETHDPQVAERATLIARYLGNNATALEMSVIWAQAAPQNTDALANASMAYLQAGQLHNAFYMSERLLMAGGTPLFQNIAANAGSLTDMERATLLAEFNRVLKKYPTEEQLLVGAGLLLQQQGNYRDTLLISRNVLKRNPNSIPAAILEANVLHQLKRDNEAVAKMAKLVELYPDNTSLRQQYARILMHYDMGQAQEQLTILAKQQPNNGDILLSLGVVALERKDTETAHQAFEQLLDKDQHLSSAHYYLGHMAEEQNDLPEAIIHYLQVDSGNDFLSATMSLLDLFVRQKDYLSAEQHLNRLRLQNPDESEALYLLYGQTLIKHHALKKADKVLSSGIAAHKNSTRLLFARAMLNNDRQDLASTERDLRRILKLDPKHAAALNSLGYILTENTDRFEEANQFLQQAIALSPNDPAIMDSMGWLLYRTGKYSEALTYLRKAYAAAPAPEIGAHLGEILWVLGDKDAARNIWKESLEKNPNDPHIRATLTRLKADLS